nr:phage holin family protein [Pseudopontixanthobacter vadosimaris]
MIGHLTSQSAHLAQQQISLVQAEMREAVNDLKTAMGAMAGAAVLGISGLGVTLMGIAYLLGEAIDNLGLATLLVGIAVLIIAGILYASGKKKMEHTDIKPERSIETAERTPDAATGNLTNSGVTR